MALNKCKECGKEVSSQAKTCPHCGAPVQAGGIFAMAILIAVFFVLILVYAALYK